MNGVVIWHIGLCGSTLLGSTLNQNPEIQWENEIFVPLLWRKRAGELIPSMPEALAEVAARRTRPLQVVEVKFLSTSIRLSSVSRWRKCWRRFYHGAFPASLF